MNMKNWNPLSGNTAMSKRLAALILSIIAIFAPVMAMAAGAEANIKLEFSQSDRIYLIISLVLGFASLGFAYIFWSRVKNSSPGNEKMQEVGEAIRAGAMGYLSQQFKTMAIFVVVIAFILVGMYLGQYGAPIAIATAFCFILGVGASYVAGYVGMKAAVSANMRVAHAALSSYKSSLEIAFQAGSVAGLVTVGMGLIGATAIFLTVPEHATKLLIGFGFGGSLAALFMRVGGGIFTKAADVGADLVGKVEAGIPEDDPRNPATIADNVGDNVGDCAGMAADVFESYEVTLVAAIVLGASTAALFPTEMWMRLILFALMARGAGVVASIVGIYMVKGTDDISVDPLKSIRRGFYSSAVIAGVATLGIAWYMLGGANSAQIVKTNELVSSAFTERNNAEVILKTANEIAKKENKALYEISGEEVYNSKAVQDLKLVDAYIERVGATDITEEQRTSVTEQVKGQVAQIVSAGEAGLPPEEDFSEFKSVNLKNTSEPVAQYAVIIPSEANPATPTAPTASEYETLGAIANGDGLGVYQLSVTSPALDAEGKPDPTKEAKPQKFWIGVTARKVLDQTLKQFAAMSPDAKITVEKEYPATIFVNREGKVLAGIDVDPKDLNLSSVQPLPSPTGAPAPFGYTVPVDKVKAFETAQKENPAMTGALPAMAMELVYIKHKTAEWWRFFACVVFGLIMAFVFEALTDYYVGLHKRPVQELGQVSTAGPAPMIITGFAYGQESSVFSVFAIVACLLGPLMIFPPAEFGGYLLSFYGIALVGLGLLTTTGFILAMDTFGPISDNAQGVFEMSGAHHDSPDGARRVQLLDAAGNTTKALTKGFAIATAVVAAVALFHAYVEEGMLTQIGMRLEVPEIFLGLLIGGAAPYLFSAFSINAVGRAAFELINEVRAQFRNDPGIMAGTSKPNYAKCVAIVTAAAQRELLGPGILAIFFPVVVGFGFAIGKPLTTINGVEYNLVGAQALGGFLAGSILSGQLMAVLLANSGGMWDNAKKLIEDGLHGGKGTEAHKAAVVCDTVGDPFKDTAGPALNPLIKVMNLVGLLLAPAVIANRPPAVGIGITIFAAAMLVIAIWWSKRGSMGSGMAAAEGDHTPETREVEEVMTTSVTEADPEEDKS